MGLQRRVFGSARCRTQDWAEAQRRGRTDALNEGASVSESSFEDRGVGRVALEWLEVAQQAAARAHSWYESEVDEDKARGERLGALAMRRARRAAIALAALVASWVSSGAPSGRGSSPFELPCRGERGEAARGACSSGSGCSPFGSNDRARPAPGSTRLSCPCSSHLQHEHPSPQVPPRRRRARPPSPSLALLAPQPPRVGRRSGRLDSTLGCPRAGQGASRPSLTPLLVDPPLTSPPLHSSPTVSVVHLRPARPAPALQGRPRPPRQRHRLGRVAHHHDPLARPPLVHDQHGLQLDPARHRPRRQGRPGELHPGRARVGVEQRRRRNGHHVHRPREHHRVPHHLWHPARHRGPHRPPHGRRLFPHPQGRAVGEQGRRVRARGASPPPCSSPSQALELVPTPLSRPRRSTARATCTTSSAARSSSTSSPRTVASRSSSLRVRSCSPSLSARVLLDGTRGILVWLQGCTR